MANLRLPSLREEIALLPAAPLLDGQPSWTLHDPVRNQFFQLDWASFEMLRRWSLDGPQAIVADINATTTLHLTPADLDALLQFLGLHQLLRPRPGSAGQLAERLAQRRGAFWQWLLHNYLFFRIPLVRPDRWLGRHVGQVAFLFSHAFLWLTVLAGVVGVFNVFRTWEAFSTTLIDMVSPQGLLAYGSMIVAVKVLHELGHGFAAKRHGCRVPTMGIAFLVMWPVAYTDTNDVWKLTRRDQRLGVAAAGIATELALAAWATLAWGWLPEGAPKTLAFLLSTTTWLSSIFINASPFMRFDGYFLLADALQLPNLHERAFALARWDLRRRLFALDDPPPEQFPPGRQRFLILFAWATWIYRLVVFLGIAALVYHFFIKALGILLFMVEIGWFVARPFYNEFRVWHARWAELRQHRRARVSLVLSALLFTLFLLPWPSRVATSGLLQPAEQWPIYAPENARLATLPFRNCATIRAGQPDLSMHSPALQTRSEQGEAREARLAWQSEAAGLNASLRKDWQVLNEQLQTARAEIGSISADASRYTPTAPYDGVLADVPPDLKAGDWLARGELLGRLLRQGELRVVTYVTDEDIHRIRHGNRALFISDGLDGPVVHLEVAGIDQDASRTLPEPELASTFGGPVAVREKNGVFYPERAVYRVQLKVTAPAPPAASQHAWRGQVVIAGDWEAPGLRFLRSALSVFWRETGF